MGFFDSLSSGLSSFASGVGSAFGSIVSNPNFQNAAIGLGTQYLQSAIQKRTAPPPSPYAVGPSLNQQWTAAQMGGQMGNFPQQQRSYTPASRPPSRPPVGSPYRNIYQVTVPPQLAQRGSRGSYPTQIPASLPRGVPSNFAPTNNGTDILSQLLQGGGLQGGIMPAFPGLSFTGTEGGGFLQEAGERVSGLIGGNQTMFRYGQQTARALPMLEAQHPETGKMHYWRHMGRPILFSGDMAVCKRVSRVRGKLNRGRPRRPR